MRGDHSVSMRPSDVELPLRDWMKTAPSTVQNVKSCWAYRLLMAGDRPNAVAKHLGNANTSVTLDTCSHVIAGMPSQAVDSVAGKIFGGGT